jgi:hypothetical protein
MVAAAVGGWLVLFACLASSSGLRHASARPLDEADPPLSRERVVFQLESGDVVRDHVRL